MPIYCSSKASNTHALLDTNRCRRRPKVLPIRSDTASTNEADGIRTRRSGEFDDVDSHSKSYRI
jgi:hypothetical protein